jgi:hypothetical protein
MSDMDMIKTRKKKKYVNQIDNKNYLILSKIFMGAVFLEIYFVASFMLSNNIKNTTSQVLSEFNITINSESFYR